jgi:CopG family transcriptional regulator, nickel-responsive regulator
LAFQLSGNFSGELDNYTAENQFANRSQAIRHLINNNIIASKWNCNNIVAGSITLVYEHNKRDLINRLTGLQHDYHDVILSTQHFHLDKNVMHGNNSRQGESRPADDGWQTS